MATPSEQECGKGCKAHSTREHAAFDEGWRARLKGVSEDANPYNGTDLYLDWRAGWRCAA